ADTVAKSVGGEGIRRPARAGVRPAGGFSPWSGGRTEPPGFPPATPRAATPCACRRAKPGAARGPTGCCCGRRVRPPACARTRPRSWCPSHVEVEAGLVAVDVADLLLTCPPHLLDVLVHLLQRRAVRRRLEDVPHGRFGVGAEEGDPVV